MFGQIYKMFRGLQGHKTFKKPMICPECRSRNTCLMKKESKAWEDIEFAWYGCRNCGHKFIRKFYRKVGQEVSQRTKNVKGGCSKRGINMEGKKKTQKNQQSVVASKKKRILYIDDEKDFLLLTKIRLERSGEFEVITTIDPEEGMELAKKLQPDLILMDVIMPGLGGGRVAEILLDDIQTKRIPILFFSVLANGISSRKGKLRKIGGRDFIPKTAGYQELIMCIRKILC